jgi:hypothetical protein
MRSVTAMMLAILVATGCEGMVNPDYDSPAYQQMVAENETLMRPYTIESPDDWPASVREASSTLRADLRAGLELVGADNRSIAPSMERTYYPVFAPCRPGEPLFESGGLIKDRDEKNRLGIEEADLVDLADYWTEAGYTVTTAPYDEDGPNDQTLIHTTKPGVGFIEVAWINVMEGLDRSRVRFATECHPALTAEEDDGD